MDITRIKLHFKDIRNITDKLFYSCISDRLKRHKKELKYDK